MNSSKQTKKKISEYDVQDFKELFFETLRKISSKIILLEIGNNEIFSKRHEYKINALIKTIAIPVSAPIFLDFRIVFFLFLLTLTLLVDKLRVRNKIR